MIRRAMPLIGLCLVALAAAGCDSTYITQSARANIADFFTDIFATAIHASLTPDIY